MRRILQTLGFIRPDQRKFPTSNGQSSSVADIFYAFLFFAALVGLWEYGSVAEWWNPVLIPAPSDIGKYMAKATTEGELGSACWVTVKRLLYGYVIGIVLGIPLIQITSGTD